MALCHITIPPVRANTSLGGGRRQLATTHRKPPGARRSSSVNWSSVIAAATRPAVGPCLGVGSFALIVNAKRESSSWFPGATPGGSRPWPPVAAVMFLRKAMRYYRLWIYTCNAVLLVSVLVFISVGAGVSSHEYLALVPAPSAYHPTLLYGYLALILQIGFIQAIGSVGAIKLSEKLLNIYWFVLLFLLIGDLFVGSFWLYKLYSLTGTVEPYMVKSLQQQYGRDPDVTQVWDNLQHSSMCCGVSGPRDYNDTKQMAFVPESCCIPRIIETRSVPYQSDQAMLHVTSPQHTSRVISHSIDSLKGYSRQIADDNLSRSYQGLSCENQQNVFHTAGCGAIVNTWFLSSVHTLMILGFCVITFIKLCFVVILRFEIKEMIQKIKILHGESQCTPNPELVEALGLTPPIKPPEDTTDILGSGGVAGERRESGTGNNNTMDPESGPTSPIHEPRLNHLSSHVDGADSDTNSHCALITDTPVRCPQPSQDKLRPNGNNNDVSEYHELRHMRQTQI